MLAYGCCYITSLEFQSWQESLLQMIQVSKEIYQETYSTENVTFSGHVLAVSSLYLSKIVLHMIGLVLIEITLFRCLYIKCWSRDVSLIKSANFLNLFCVGTAFAHWAMLFSVHNYHNQQQKFKKYIMWHFNKTLDVVWSNESGYYECPYLGIMFKWWYTD